MRDQRIFIKVGVGFLAKDTHAVMNRSAVVENHWRRTYFVGSSCGGGVGSCFGFCVRVARDAGRALCVFFAVAALLRVVAAKKKRNLCWTGIQRSSHEELTLLLRRGRLAFGSAVGRLFNRLLFGGCARLGRKLTKLGKDTGVAIDSLLDGGAVVMGLGHLFDGVGKGGAQVGANVLAHGLEAGLVGNHDHELNRGLTHVVVRMAEVGDGEGHDIIERDDALGRHAQPVDRGTCQLDACLCFLVVVQRTLGLGEVQGQERVRRFTVLFRHVEHELDSRLAHARVAIVRAHEKTGEDALNEAKCLRDRDSVADICIIH